MNQPTQNAFNEIVRHLEHQNQQWTGPSDQCVYLGPERNGVRMMCAVGVLMNEDALLSGEREGHAASEIPHEDLKSEFRGANEDLLDECQALHDSSRYRISGFKSVKLDLLHLANAFNLQPPESLLNIH